jgi:predicted O-methyltransferase YrrM
MKCPDCQSIQIRKNGFYRGKQRYQCKVCARQFIEHSDRHAHHRVSTGVDEQVYQYTRAISSPIDDRILQLQVELERFPLAKMQPSLDLVQAIEILLQSMAARRVLEVGIFSGYSTLAMALAMPTDGKLISSSVGGEHIELVRQHWHQAGVDDKIDLRIEDGLKVLTDLSTENPADSFDAIVIGTLKNQYLDCYDRAIELLRTGGIIIALDVLWQGRILNPHLYDDEFTRGIDRFNHTLAADDRLRTTCLPVGDGMTIAIKVSP